MAHPPVPTLYKARGMPLKQACCAICVDRTRGRTRRVTLSNRVSVHLCDAHASHEFQTRRGGRDFVRTLMGVWRANDCLTLARSRALDAHLAALRVHPARPRPGSYTWPELRRDLEGAYAAGATPAELHPAVRTHLQPYPARPPSRRTLQRWHAERRWLARAP
ncbi:MAG TPA: hypothetical protein VLK59_14960 [Solirubrobacteraceae bacterium]|jgi:hypothetical protein|nr:hypothetical protein [Solirubrobacteraceae bacterium]